MSNTLARTERDKIRREKLSAFFYDLAKLTYGGMVIGGLINIKPEEPNSILISLAMVIPGILSSFILSSIANRILKQ